MAAELTKKKNNEAPITIYKTLLRFYTFCMNFN